MKKALEYIVAQIVDDPEKVEIKEQEDQGMINFFITVAPADMGKIIGKNGKVIRAIRNVVKISAIKQNKKINISLTEIPNKYNFNMKISILTLFPEMFSGPFDYSIVKNAKEKKLVDINYINIRDFGIGRHKVVDDTPYGGGHGMILRVDVLEKAIESARDKNLNKYSQKVILLSPHGKTFDQKMALKLANLEHLILVCGHYEGQDERIKQFIDGEISIGDYIVTGGEIPAMMITDAITRLLKGVLKEGVTTSESFSKLLEYPQYTKPNTYKNLDVPPILLSGNHGKIKSWREYIEKNNCQAPPGLTWPLRM